MTTRTQWAVDLLAYAGWSESAEKRNALVAQASKEDTGAENNPIATTEPAPGATVYNSAGVRNYPTYDAGLAATVATLKNGHYPQLVGILADPTGGSAVAYCSSPELDTWGTGNCLAFLAEITSGDPQGYLTHEIVGGGSPVSPSPDSTPAPALDALTEVLNMTDPGFAVRFLYRFCLHREADPQGYTQWVQFLEKGGSLDQVMAAFQDSAEGKAVLAAERKALGL